MPNAMVACVGQGRKARGGRGDCTSGGPASTWGGSAQQGMHARVPWCTTHHDHAHAVQAPVALHRLAVLGGHARVVVPAPDRGVEGGGGGGWMRRSCVAPTTRPPRWPACLPARPRASLPYGRTAPRPHRAPDHVGRTVAPLLPRLVQLARHLLAVVAAEAVDDAAHDAPRALVHEAVRHQRLDVLNHRLLLGVHLVPAPGAGCVCVCGGGGGVICSGSSTQGRGCHVWHGRITRPVRA
jgi:hypothetical protein